MTDNDRPRRRRSDDPSGRPRRSADPRRRRPLTSRTADDDADAEDDDGRRLRRGEPVPAQATRDRGRHRGRLPGGAARHRRSRRRSRHGCRGRPRGRLDRRRRLDALVGDDGQVLEALQELTRLAVYRETGERSRLMLDIGGFRADVRRTWSRSPRRPSRRSASRARPVKLAPMSPFERKVVHDAVAAAGLRSESEGVEPTRCVVILPAADAARAVRALWPFHVKQMTRPRSWSRRCSDEATDDSSLCRFIDECGCRARSDRSTRGSRGSGAATSSTARSIARRLPVRRCGRRHRLWRRASRSGARHQPRPTCRSRDRAAAAARRLPRARWSTSSA